jgi:hypothetical protein
MFYIALAAVLMVFIGGVLIDPFLRNRPLLFIVFWGVCSWLTISAILLAIFDMLVVRAEALAARRRLERDMLTDEEHDSH